MGIDYKSESEKLEAYNPAEGGSFWTPDSGQYKITSLSELEPTDPYEAEGEEPKPRMKLKIKLEDGSEKDWTVGVGKTSASSYGQLCKLATVRGGALKDQIFTVVVTGTEKKNYTIVA